LPPPNFCTRRQRLYQAQLDATRKYFADLLRKPPFTSVDAGRLGKALADRALIEALEAIVIPYVVYGVARDLERLAKSRALFSVETSGHPALSEVLPPDRPSPGSPLPRYKLDDTVTTRVAYTRYFDWYIDPKDVGGGKSGVKAFYERYPLLLHAVQKVTGHHQDNIRLACQRVTKDWSTIQAAFFAGFAIGELSKIETTGSDFHKGGKQVLILTFSLDKPPYSGRVVYKPSPVEIDCRIVGNSQIVNTYKPQGYRQDTSLTELINKFNPARPRPEGFTSCELPTYTILPYNRDSVADAYGYIEYLAHEPDSKVRSLTMQPIPGAVGEEVRKLTPTQVQQSDWIVEDPIDGQVFYHQLGGLLAMVLAVSLCDLHVQNVITHARSPHLIDLEEALKWPMTSVKETYLPGALGRFDQPEGSVLQVVGDLTSELRLGGTSPPGVKPAAWRLYLSRGTSAPGKPLDHQSPTDPHAVSCRTALYRGFVDVVEALAQAECNDAAKAWAAGLGQTIARFVPLGTDFYANNCRFLYRLCCERSPDLLATDNGYDAFTYSTMAGRQVSWFGEKVTGARTEWVTRGANFGPGKRDPAWHHAFFALEHPKHAWRDYLNCDVPSFYHRLGSPDLLNSDGDIVDVEHAVEWQDEYITTAPARPKGWKPNPNNTYLPQVPIDMVAYQLDDLKTACALPQDERYLLMQAKRKRAFLKTALEGTGLEGAFATGVLNADHLRATGSRRLHDTAVG
jgi:hypothetical protein